jgi:Protein kinase domain
VSAATEQVERVGPYTVEEELGRGAFGVVYRAYHDADPQTPVALKVIEARGNLDRLMLEPALVAGLDHPCIVRVLDYFVHQETRLAIALELVHGEDLKAALDGTERFAPEAVRDLLVQLGGALAEAHARGVIHRDIKPANILVDRSAGRVRYVLTDFGVGARDEGIRSEKRVAGTVLFMAPEQLRGRPGPQSDLWALGVVAYRMLTGTYPFPGPTVADVARQIQLNVPRPPGEMSGQQIDPVLERVVLRLLDRSETERIASATELLAELGHTGGSKTVLDARPARPASRVEARRQSLDETLRRGIRRNYLWMTFWFTLYLLLTNPITGIVTLAGLVVFYRAHAWWHGWRKALGILAALALVLLTFSVLFIPGLGALQQPATKQVFRLAAEVSEWIGVPESSIFVLALIQGAFGLTAILLPVLACSAYARANRLRRERVLLQAASAGTASDEYLDLLRRELDYRYEDVGFHLKYAEALAGRGDHRAAAVEARLLLVQDPYHFTGNLLLAQSYYRLGLFADGERVCAAYLAVAGYAFEFQELRDQCRAARGEST